MYPIPTSVQYANRSILGMRVKNERLCSPLYADDILVMNERPNVGVKYSK